MRLAQVLSPAERRCSPSKKKCKKGEFLALFSDDDDDENFRLDVAQNRKFCFQHTQSYCYLKVATYPALARATTAEDDAERKQRAEALRADGMTQGRIAEELGVSQDTISKDLKRNPDAAQKVFKPKPKRERRELRLYPSTNPTKAAERIVEKLGADFAQSLAEATQGGDKALELVRKEIPGFDRRCDSDKARLAVGKGAVHADGDRSSDNIIATTSQQGAG